jgi:hypothetical protein
VDTWKAQGITFREGEPPATALPLAAALVALAQRFPGTPTAARYGVMDARTPAVGLAGERREPVVWNRQVWVITLPAQWVPHGARGFPPPSTEPLPMNYVLDGETGQYLFGFGP